jgi:hypothetical protein
MVKDHGTGTQTIGMGKIKENGDVRHARSEAGLSMAVFLKLKGLGGNFRTLGQNKPDETSGHKTRVTIFLKYIPVYF